MRYYNFALYATSDEIKEKTTINLREYGYDNTLIAVNNYMFRHLQNGISFLAYREEGNTILAVFSYDEMNVMFRDAYASITAMLGEVFFVKRIKSDPEEITMYQMLDYINEAKRREYTSWSSKYLESIKLQVCNYYTNAPKVFHYDFDERIVPENKKYAGGIYDQAFISELKNVEEHANETNHKTNMVHYVISSRSVESASDMTEVLMQQLYKSKRISGRRMEIISQIEPGIYRELNHLEEIIENNYGGVIVFDLTEKFDCDSVDYTTTSRYILNLLKRYRNKCLFVFTYRMDNPGFLYQILPHIKKYVIPVMLREGKGDRKEAVKYMKTLIRDSEYAEYAGQAAEFLKLFPGNDFSQTDVLMAYEQFESWCLNKNVLHAYDYDLSQGFMLDRDSEAESPYDRMNKLVGLDIVKKQIDSIIATYIVEKERRKRKGKDYQTGCMHMIFGGNPGSAKTMYIHILTFTPGEYTGNPLRRGVAKKMNLKEIMPMAKTISFVKGKGSLHHNNRKFIASNIDEERITWNITYIQQSLAEAYEQLFGEAVAEYNAKQRRSDRKIDDYLSKIKHYGNNEKVFYENVVQIGKMSDTGVVADDGTISVDASKAQEVLDEYARTF